MQNLVLLDSNTTKKNFCNHQYVTNRRKANIPLVIQTNGGTMTVTETYNIPYPGTTYIVYIIQADMSLPMKIKPSKTTCMQELLTTST